MLGRAPGESLHGKGRVPRATCSHYGSAEDAEVRDLVSEAPPVDHIGSSGPYRNAHKLEPVGNIVKEKLRHTRVWVAVF